MTTLRYKHSGALGDLIYSLPIVQHLGPGEFYLHLNQIDWIGQHYYGSQPAEFHRGRLTQHDLEYLQDFMLVQHYIESFEPMTDTTEITHNLDRFRTAFVGHPGNYVDIYANTFGIRDPATQQHLRDRPWLTVPMTKTIPDRPIVVNRTERWIPATPPDQWRQWQNQGWDQRAVFLGLPAEFRQFRQITGWTNTVYYPTATMLQVAEIIAGAETFIGNQSSALALAIGLGIPAYVEQRRDLPQSRNECYFPNNPKITYF
jgi:hypothetical protein